MPNNDVRSRNRTYKRKKNAAKTRRILWGVIIVTVAILIILKIWEVDFNSIKRSITQGSQNVVSSSAENIYPYSLDSAKIFDITPQNDKLNIMTDISCMIFNPTTGNVDYTFNHGFSNPVLKTAGNYFFVFDQGNDRVRLDNLSENIYETNFENSVLCADLSKTGTVIYAVKGKDTKCELYVINKSLKKELKYKVNDGYIVSVAIDESGKRCAFATINSKNAKLITTIHTINIGDKKERAEFNLEETNILDLHYCEKDLFVIGDNCVSRVTSQKRLKEIFKIGEVNTCCFNYTKYGELVYVYSKYSSANENYLTYINSVGKIKTTVELKQKPKYVSSSSNEMTVLFTDKVITYSLTDGTVKYTAECDDSVSAIHKLSTKCFICRHQVIDVLEMKQKEKK